MQRYGCKLQLNCTAAEEDEEGRGGLNYRAASPGLRHPWVTSVTSHVTLSACLAVEMSGRLKCAVCFFLSTLT